MNKNGRSKYSGWYGYNDPGTYSKPSISQRDLAATQVVDWIKVRNGIPQVIVKGKRLG